MSSAKYNPQKLEPKWRKRWELQKLYKTSASEVATMKRIKKAKPKVYVLDMFPYPSGKGLHVGHPKGYIATDIYSRTKSMQGYNILHPMGWDAFGLPAENYAIKHEIHPKTAVEKNVARFKEQLSLLGFNYDWEHEINTTDPKYYKWTQWIFLQLFKNGLAYQSFEPINWCKSCKTGLANEDVENGLCERCDTPVEQKPMRQWVLKITDYAEKMLKDLDELDWEEHIKEAQKNWIGRSNGVSIKFQIQQIADKSQTNSKQFIEIFTTRADTIFGATYLVLAPEHEILENRKLKIKNIIEIEKYIQKTKNKTELDRKENKIKTGIELKGIYAINPINGKKIPVWVSDYVLTGYGAGAIMAVPAHDQRDFEFAQKFNLPIKQVICENYPAPICPILKKAFIGNGYLVDSEKFNGLPYKKGMEKIIALLSKKKLAKKTVNYKLKDWVFSRQRYWGEPIPIIYCCKCWENSKLQLKNKKLKENYDYIKINNLEHMIVPVPERDLPVELPKIKNYKPTGTGESPLANIAKWVNVKCPKCKNMAVRETNTMPQWAGSSWYYLRYIDPKNNKILVDKKKELYWSPVDIYVGGAEHATRHLIYARFWHKFLYDIDIVNYSEPFKKLYSVGLIKGEDGRKMSKRWDNVINPDDIVERFGADTLRVYEMFMGPFSDSIAWNSDNLMGAKRFLEKVWRIFSKTQSIENKTQTKSNPLTCGQNTNKILEKLLHQTIKKVTEDIENFKFNTAISSLMIFINELQKEQKNISTYKFMNVSKVRYFSLQDLNSKFLLLLAPFAPHLAEELWNKLGNKQSIHLEAWPKYNKNLILEEKANIIVQVNGKTRTIISIDKDANENAVKKIALQNENIKKWVSDLTIKTIFACNKIINFITC